MYISRLRDILISCVFVLISLSLSLKVMTSLRRRRSSFDDEPAQY